jgi:hypothetical protein
MLGKQGRFQQWFQPVQNGQQLAWFRVVEQDFDFTTFNARA